MALRNNIEIDQGSAFSTTITVTSNTGATANLTGYTANSLIKKHFSSLNTAATFTASVNGQLGQVTLSLTANQTSNIVSGRYVYDVKISDPFDVPTRIVEGIATINPKVT
jgi:hypothetical protein